MTLFVLGSGGLLGQAVVAAAGQRGRVVREVARPAFDLTDGQALDALFADVRAGDWLINTAAFTAVDEAETREDEAGKINGDLVAELARRAHGTRAKLVQISTDYVFAGDKHAPYVEDDLPAPLGAYGRTKLAGERALQTAARDVGFREWMIVRTAWLFGPGGKNFVATIVDAARTRDRLKVVTDQIGSPTYSPHLAQMILRLIEVDARGTFHAANSGFATWFDLAREAVSAAQLATPIDPCTTREFPRPAPRPANSRLALDKLVATLRWSPPHWRVAVREYVTQFLLVVNRLAAK